MFAYYPKTMRQQREWFHERPERRARSLTGLVLLAWLQACAPTQPQLNSERIEERFGSVGIDVVSSDAGLRRANLYSLHDGTRICRTYALVRFQPRASGQQDPALLAAEREIHGGASLGAALRRAGWQVEKRTRYVGSLPALEPPPDWVAWMRIGGTEGLAIHVYELYIKKGSQVIDFAKLTEVHHPDYLRPPAVAALYPVAPGDVLDEGGIASVVDDLENGT